VVQRSGCGAHTSLHHIPQFCLMLRRPKWHLSVPPCASHRTRGRAFRRGVTGVGTRGPGTRSRDPVPGLATPGTGHRSPFARGWLRHVTPCLCPVLGRYRRAPAPCAVGRGTEGRCSGHAPPCGGTRPWEGVRGVRGWGPSAPGAGSDETRLAPRRTAADGAVVLGHQRLSPGGGGANDTGARWSWSPRVIPRDHPSDEGGSGGNARPRVL
jgi:hypothetical protein